MNVKNEASIKASPFKVVIPYLLVSVCWIYFSDSLLRSMVHDIDLLSKIQTFKGLAFVCMVGAFLFYLVRKNVGAVAANYQAMLDQERIYRTMIENSNDITIFTDGNGKLKYSATSIAGRFGYSIEEFNELNLHGLILQEDYEIAKPVFDAMANNPFKVFNAEFRVKHKNGELIWIGCSMVNHLDDPLIQGVITNARDISEKKKAEERIRNNERLFRSVFEQAIVGIAMADTSGKRVLANTKFCDLGGYSLQEVLDMPLGQMIHPADKVGGVMENTKRIFAGELDEYNTECRLVRKNNEIIWIDYDMHVIRDDGGNILYFLQIIKDVNDKKIAEDALNFKNKELDTFIYRSSHDLRGPIATLLGITDLAQTEISDTDAVQYFKDCNGVAINMQKILTDLMAVTQIKQSEVCYSILYPADLTDAVLDRIQFDDCVLHEHVIVSVDKELTFTTDASLLSIVLKALIENAIRYTSNDEPKHRVSVDISVSNGIMAIRIKDNGIGIPLAEQDKIFDLFYHGQSVKRGSGIGLYLVKSALLKLNGSVNVSSIPGLGTEMLVTIPHGNSA